MENSMINKDSSRMPGKEELKTWKVLKTWLEKEEVKRYLRTKRPSDISDILEKMSSFSDRYQLNPDEKKYFVVYAVLLQAHSWAANQSHRNDPMFGSLPILGAINKRFGNLTKDDKTRFSTRWNEYTLSPEKSTSIQNLLAEQTISNFEAVVKEAPDLFFKDRRQPGEKFSFANPESYVVAEDNFFAEGGFKIVYRVHQSGVGQLRAFKELKDSSARETMIHEAEIQASLSHQGVPMIVAFHENDAYDDLPRIVEQFIDGPSWDKFIDQKSVDENLEILLKVADTIGYAHRSGVVHGDLKPENVVCVLKKNVLEDKKETSSDSQETTDSKSKTTEQTPFGEVDQVFVLDWGSAEKWDVNSTQQPLRGYTPEYVSPEKVATPTSDVFMLGGILHRIVTKYTFNQFLDEFPNLVRRKMEQDGVRLPSKPPVIQSGTNDKWEQEGDLPVSTPPVMASTDVVPPSIVKRNWEQGRAFPNYDKLKLQPKLNALLEIAKNALAFDPNDRFQNADEFAVALRAYQKTTALLSRFRRAEQKQRQLNAWLDEYDAKPKTNVVPETIVRSDYPKKQNDLFANINEFVSIREEWNALKENDVASSMFSTLEDDAKQAEFNTRKNLIRRSIASKNYEQADSLLKIQEELSASTVDPVLVDLRKKLDAGLAEQRRAEKRKNVIAALSGLFVLAIALGIFGIQYQNYVAEQEKRHIVEDRLFANLENNYQRATREHLSQVGLTFRGEQVKLAKESEEKDKKASGRFNKAYNLCDIASKTTLLPEKSSSFSPPIKTVAFSKDGSCFVTYDGTYNVMIWDAKTLEGTVQDSIRFGEDLTTWIDANPLFVDKQQDDVLLSSQFLLFNQSGEIWLVPSKENEELEFLFNLNNTHGWDADVMVSARPVYMSSGDDKHALMIVGLNTGEVVTISLPENKIVSSFKTDQEQIARLAVSESKEYIVAVGTNGTIKRYSMEGNLLDDFDFGFPETPNPAVGTFVRNVDINPSGDKIVASCESGDIVVWDVEQKVLLCRVHEPEVEGTVGNVGGPVVWTDDRHFVATPYNNDYRIWDVSKLDQDGNPSSTIIEHDQNIAYSGPRIPIAVSQVNKQVLIIGNDRVSRLIDLQSGKQIAQTEGVFTSVATMLAVTDSAYFAACDRLLVGTYGTNSLVSYDPKSLQVERTFLPYENVSIDEFQHLKNLPTCLAVPSVGTEFAVALESGDVAIFDVAESLPKRFLQSALPEITELSPETDVPMLAVNPEASTLAGSSMRSETIELWNWKDLSKIKTLKKARNTFSSGMVFLSKDKLLEVSYDMEKNSNTLIIWNVNTEETQVINLDTPRGVSFASSLSLSNDKTQLALGFQGGYFQIVSLKDGKKIFDSTNLGNLPEEFKTRIIAKNESYSPKGGIAKNESYSPEGGVNLRMITNIEWSQDDRFLLISFENGQVVMVTLEHSYPEFVKADGTSQIMDMSLATNLTSNQNLGVDFPFVGAFFLNSKKLATVCSDGNVKIWDYNPSQEQPVTFKDARADKIEAIPNNDEGWAGVHEGLCFPLPPDSFFVYQNLTNTSSKPDIEDFNFWNSPSGKKGWLLTDKNNGKLLFMDQDSGRVELEERLNNAPNFPQKGFAKIVTSPDGQWIVGISKITNKYLSEEIPDVYLHNYSGGKWEKLLESEVKEAIVSPDSQTLALVDGNTLRLWDLSSKPNRELASSSKFPMVGPISSKIMFLSDDLLVQSGRGNDVYIWNIKTRTLFQKLNVPIHRVADLYVIRGIEGLNKGELAKNRPLSFVLGCPDGILRFYSLSSQTGLFEPIYVVSSLQLATLIKDKKQSPDQVLQEINKKLQEIVDSHSEQIGTASLLSVPKEPNMSQDLTDFLEDFSQQNPEDEFEEELMDVNSYSKDIIEELGHSQFDETDTNKRFIQDIALSSNGKKLYVASIYGVVSYDMEEIWRNIDALPEKWKNINVEDLTGLHYDEEKGLKVIQKCHMIRNEKIEEEAE